MHTKRGVAASLLVFVVIVTLAGITAVTTQTADSPTGEIHRGFGGRLMFCVDSDEGIEAEVQGTAKITYRGSVRQKRTDECRDNTLIEAYCDQRRSRIRSKNIPCEFGCAAGACLIESPTEVVAIEEVLAPVEEVEVEVPVPVEEVEVEVPAQICKDTDVGINKYTAGTVTADGQTKSDACYSGNLIEYYCDSNNKLGTAKFNCGYLGCKNGACVSTPETVTVCDSYSDMDPCLDNANCYWDQQTDQCYMYAKFVQTCSDPDGGYMMYEQAHTFGFRRFAADARDARIRTGGSDACFVNNMLREHFCSDTYFIETAEVACPYGCSNGACVEEEVPAISCVDYDNSLDYTAIDFTFPITPEKYPAFYEKSIGKGDYVGSGSPVILGTEPNPTAAKPSPDPHSHYFDHCVGETQLNEAFCKEDGKLGAHSINCPNGCQNGACI